MSYTPDGTPVTNFSVAANKQWTRSDGSHAEETVWYRVTTWRRLAEICGEYVKKGMLVLVVGELKPGEDGNPRTWTTNSGEVRSSFEITASTVKFLDRRTSSHGDDEEEEIPY
jgi:single-strand DNA-binding protein